MASSKSQTKRRTSLFYNKYRYQAQCQIPGVCYTYYTKNIEEFKKKMARITDTRKKLAPQGVMVMGDDWQSRLELVDYDRISLFFDWRKRYDPDQYTCRIQTDTVSFFSNDQQILETLRELDPEVKFSEAEVFGKPDVKYLKREPKYKFRTFFRGRRAPDNFKTDVQQFAATYRDSMSVCPGLLRAVYELRRPFFRYIHSSYYVDYNDESTLSLLHMYFGSMIGRTYRLEKEPEA